MAIYPVQYKVNTNVPYDDLLYEISLYKEDVSGNKTIVLPTTTKNNFTPDFKTQKHNTIDIPEGQSTIYIMKVTLYRLIADADFKVHEETSIYSLGKINGFNIEDTARASRDGICYYETSQPTRKQKKGAKNVYQQRITRKADGVFESPQHPHGDAKDPFSYSAISKELNDRRILSASRKTGDGYPNQGETMLCGPAAFVYCLMMDRFDLYEQAIWDLRNTGKTRIGALVIDADNDGIKRPDDYFRYYKDIRKNVLVEYQILPSVDWIFMASLRDSSNMLSSYNSVNDNISAVTLWSTIQKWFDSVGSKLLLKNINMSGVNQETLCEFGSYIDDINHSTHVVTLVSAEMMTGSSATINVPNHWIVWEGKVGADTTGTLKYDDVTLVTGKIYPVDLNLFTWGSVKTSNFKSNVTLDDFIKHLYGGMVFSKIP